MARTVSPTVRSKRVRMAILRSVYFKQNLPREVLESNAMLVASELNALQLSGFVRKGEGGMALTETGYTYLRELFRGGLPKMIDIPRDAMLPEQQTRELIVGRSLANAIVREVSLGE